MFNRDLTTFNNEVNQMENYHSLSFSNVYSTILNNTTSGYNGKKQLFTNLMEWAGFQSSSASISPIINGKRPVPTGYCDEIEKHGNFEKVVKCMKDNIIPHLRNVDNTVAELCALMDSDTTISQSTLKQMYHAYTEPAVFLSYALYYSITCKNNSPVSIASLSQSVNISQIMSNNFLPKSRTLVFGREKECKTIEKKLKKYSIIFLWGTAGIGKSELARHYISSHKASYSNVIYIPFASSIKESVAHLSFSDDLPNQSIEERYENHLRHIKSCDSSTIILLDNFNLSVNSDPDLNNLISGEYQIIVTSRNKPIDFPELKIQELATDDCINLFKHHGPANLSKDKMQELILKVYKHTLLIIMVARTLKFTELTLEELLLSLEKTLLETPTNTNIPITKDGVTENTLYHKYLLNLIEINNISSTELDLLCALAFMPIDGITTKRFMDYMQQKSLNEINHLIELGYISCEELEESRLLLHPLIAEVCMERQSSSLPKIIKNFSSNFLFSVYKEKNYADITEQRIAISLYERIVKLDTFNFCYEAIELVVFFMKCGQFFYIDEVSEYISKHKSILKESELPYVNALTSYYQGMSHLQLEQPQLAQQDFSQAAEFLSDLTSFSLNEADLYFNALIEGAACINNDSLAITELEKLQITQYDLPDSLYESLISRLDFKLGSKYLNLYNYELAQKHFEHCIAIRNKIYGKDSLNTGLVYGNIGFLFQAKHSYLLAAKNYEYALKILQKNLPENHINIIRLHTNLGTTYGCLANESTYKLASEMHFKQATKALDNLYGKNATVLKEKYRNYIDTPLGIISLAQTPNRPFEHTHDAWKKLLVQKDFLLANNGHVPGWTDLPSDKEVKDNPHSL